MTTGAREQHPRLTPKGQRTRARIVETAARLIYEQGVAATTIDGVKAAAEVSGSQMYHYFADKNELVQAVINHRAEVTVGIQRQADLSTAEGLQAWRNMIVTHTESAGAKGGCPLGALGSQLAESDPEARTLVAGGFQRWSEAISEGLRALQAAGHLAADADLDDLGITLLATLQGGLLLAQVNRSTRPLEVALDTFLALACGGAGDAVGQVDRRGRGQGPVAKARSEDLPESWQSHS